VSIDAVRKHVAQFVLLRLQVVLSVFRGRDFARDAFRDADARTFQGSDLVWIIGEQSHLLNPKSLEDFGRHAELALVGLETKPLIGFDRVEAAVLQRVRLKLGHEPDAATLLLFVDENARALLRDHRKSHFELLAAIAAQRPKNIASQALGVNANERRTGLDVAHDQGNGFFGFGGRCPQSEPVNQEVSPSGGEISGSNLFDLRRTHSWIISGRVRLRGVER
jgi:hypothetical protein